MRVVLYLADVNERWLVDYALSNRRTRRMKHLKNFHPVDSMNSFPKAKVTYLGVIDETRQN